MRIKKILSGIIILAIIGSVVLIYLHFKQTQQAPPITGTQKANAVTIPDTHIIKDFVYIHYKKEKKLFILKAKEHSLSADQRSDFKIVDLIFFDDQENEIYRIHADEGIITDKKDLVILRNKITVVSSKGWKIKTALMNYYPETEKVELLNWALITWEEKKAKANAFKINYYPRRDFIELLEKVELSQEKDNDTIKLNGDYMSIDERNNITIIKGEPAQIGNTKSRITGKEIEVINFAKSKDIQEVNVLDEAYYFYQPQEGEQSLQLFEVSGNRMNVCFVQSGYTSGWNISENVKMNTVLADSKENGQKSDCTIDAPYMESYYDSAGNLSKIVSKDEPVFELLKAPYKFNQPKNVQSHTMTIAFSGGKEHEIEKFIFEGDVRITSEDGEGKANSVEYNKKADTFELHGNSQWKNKDFIIKADKIHFDKSRDELSAANEKEKLVEALMISKDKPIFSKEGNQNLVIFSKLLTIVKGEITFKENVFLSSKGTIIYSDLLKLDKNHTQLLAEKIKDLKIMNEKGDAASYRIKSEKMKYEKDKKEFHFQESVELKSATENLRILSDKLTAVMDEQNALKTAKAEGNVKFYRNKITGNSKKADYNIKNDEITLLDTAELIDSNNNKLRGDILKLNLKDERIIVAGKTFHRTESIYMKEPEIEKKQK